MASPLDQHQVQWPRLAAFQQQHLRRRSMVSGSHGLHPPRRPAHHLESPQQHHRQTYLRRRRIPRRLHQLLRRRFKRWATHYTLASKRSLPQPPLSVRSIIHNCMREKERGMVVG